MNDAVSSARDFIKEVYRFPSSKLESGLRFGGWLAACFNESASKAYAGPYAGFIHGYAHDITLAFGGYCAWTLISPTARQNKVATASMVFLGCSAMEAMQGLGWYKGTFDPGDFVAYAVGAGVALGIDALCSRKRTFDTLVER